MCPILFHLGPMTLYTYGALTALSVAIAYGVSLKRAKKLGFSEEFISDLLFWVFLAGVVGSRAAYVLQNAGQFAQNPVSAFLIWQGGLVWYGGFVAGALAAFILARIKKQPIAALADFLAPVLALSHGIGRIGCFMNGCCGGKEIFGLKQPVQLYESAGLFVLAGILFQLSKRKVRAGSIFLIYLLSYGILRFILEFWREGQDLVAGLTGPQWVSVGFILISGVLWKKLI